MNPTTMFFPLIAAADDIDDDDVDTLRCEREISSSRKSSKRKPENEEKQHVSLKDKMTTQLFSGLAEPISKDNKGQKMMKLMGYV